MGWLRYAIACGAVVGVAVAMRPFRDALDVLDVGLLFLMLSFVLGLTLGAGPSAVAAVLSFVLFDVFFIPPYNTLSINRTDHGLALVVYLGVAVTTARLVARVRDRTEIAVREQRRTQLLYDLNATLVGGITVDAMLGVIVSQVVRVYGAERCRMLLPDPAGDLLVRAQYPAGGTAAIDRAHRGLAAHAMETGQPAGRGRAGHRVRAPHAPTQGRPRFLSQGVVDVLYVPIATSGRTIGVMEVSGRPGGGDFPTEDIALLSTFAGQAALALERTRLGEDAARVSALAQSDELKTALLAAVSHDLRTPLAAIKASATSLLDTSVAWDAGSRTAFLEAIDEETDRLTRMIENLLDLSRIQGGALQPDWDWYDLAELIDDVANRLRPLSSAHAIQIDVAADTPPLYLDYVKITQVLVNLGENALKYTPPGTVVMFRGRRLGGATEILVMDTGPGIPAAQRPRIFEKFYRAETGSGIPGSGIGLALVRGFVEAHGGEISVTSGVGSGTTFRIVLPDRGPAPMTETGQPQ